MVVKVTNCSICQAPIPQGKTRDQLMGLGYSGCQLGSPRSHSYANLVFCPNHTTEEKAAHIEEEYKKTTGIPLKDSRFVKVVEEIRIGKDERSQDENKG